MHSFTTLPRDIKTAIEGRVWIMNTTTNDILYENTVRSLEEFYIRNALDVTHIPQTQAPFYVYTEKHEVSNEDCDELVVVMIVSFLFSLFFLFFVVMFNQMLP